MFDKTYSFLFIILILILSTHAAALGGFLSYGIWWLDMALHFLGGIWLAIFVFWYLFEYKKSGTGITEIKSQYYWDLISGKILFLGLISFAVFAGVLWEFFEFSWDYFVAGPYGIILAQRNLQDTMSDLFFDLAGALVAVVYISYYYRLGFHNSKKEE